MYEFIHIIKVVNRRFDLQPFCPFQFVIVRILAWYAIEKYIQSFDCETWCPILIVHFTSIWMDSLPPIQDSVQNLSCQGCPLPNARVNFYLEMIFFHQNVIISIMREEKEEERDRKWVTIISYSNSSSSCCEKMQTKLRKINKKKVISSTIKERASGREVMSGNAPYQHYWITSFGPGHLNARLEKLTVCFSSGGENILYQDTQYTWQKLRAHPMREKTFKTTTEENMKTRFSRNLIVRKRHKKPTNQKSEKNGIKMRTNLFQSPRENTTTTTL